jgi:hypothetical protein
VLASMILKKINLKIAVTYIEIVFYKRRLYPLIFSFCFLQIRIFNMKHYLTNLKKLPNTSERIEVIPVYLHEELCSGAKLNFKDELVDFQLEETLLLLKNSALPILVRETLDLLDHGCLNFRDVECLREFGLELKVGETINLDLINEGDFDVKIIAICIEKSSFGYFYIEALVLDPLKRLWQISPGRYSEGWFTIENESDKKASEYAQLNDLDLKTLIR